MERRGPEHMNYVEYSGLLEQRDDILSQNRSKQQEYDVYQTALARLRIYNRTRLMIARAGNSATSGESSTDIPARRSNDENNTDSQKRKRAGEHERRSSQLSSVSLDAIAKETSLGKSVNVVRTGNQKQLLSQIDLIYQIDCDRGDSSNHPAIVFRDEPALDPAELIQEQNIPSARSHLNGNVPIFDPETVLDEGVNGPAFVVVRTIKCSNASIQMARNGTSLRWTDKIYLKSRVSKDILQKIAMCHFQSHSQDKDNLHDDPSMGTCSLGASYPYSEIAPLKLFLFHLRFVQPQYIEVHPTAQDLVDGLLQYSNSRYGRDFEEAETLLAQDLVSQAHILKLYKPNDLVVSEMSGQPSAFVVHDWPQADENNCITLKCWSFQTDGVGFARKLTVFLIPPVTNNYQAVSSLVVYPIRYAKPEIHEKIRINGQKHWDLRTTTHVMYKGWDVERDQHYINSRFIIDNRTYRKMHDEATAFTFDKPETVYPYDTMPVYLSLDAQPSQTLLSLLPSTIYGFDLSAKRWVNLRLDSIYPVCWDKNIYNRLVLPGQLRDQLKTLILAQNSRRGVGQGTGALNGPPGVKGGGRNGLTMLLQGGPGTGKTLIARSMAEIVETPLYRVTCRDIERNSESAENDLSFILGLSRTWKCMLVLDGAQILLQESSIPSSKRDSIVTNIVEILDRYDGIVILVSSRVGVFDGRIISRIQVPLHLANLNHISRKKIWQNMVDQLEEDGEHANVADIRSRLDDLAAKESNGHQIRNVLKTAKELATYRHERLDWGHLQQAALLSSGFTI